MGVVKSCGFLVLVFVLVNYVNYLNGIVCQKFFFFLIFFVSCAVVDRVNGSGGSGLSRRLTGRLPGCRLGKVPGGWAGKVWESLGSWEC